jgi:hypothetical protein
MTESQILTLTEADREHRRTFMEYCVTAAEERYQRLLRVLYEHFEAWNQDFFAGQLFPPHFLILAPKSPSAEGDYMPYSGWGSKSQLRLRPSLFDATHPHLVNGSRDPEGLQRYWLDVALHEVVHQYCNEILGKPERAEKGHGNTFAKECTRIGKLLGLAPVGPARKSRNRESLPSCAFWPSNVRPADYYLGAYRPDLAPKRGKAAPAGAPGAPDTGGEGDDEEGIDTSTQPERSKVLQPAEWHRLLAAVRDLAIAELVERLATHHGVPVIYPITPPALVEPPATVAETLAIVLTPPTCSGRPG